MAQVKLVKEKNRVVSKVHEVSKRNRKQQKSTIIYIYIYIYNKYDSAR